MYLSRLTCWCLLSLTFSLACGSDETVEPLTTRAILAEGERCGNNEYQSTSQRDPSSNSYPICAEGLSCKAAVETTSNEVTVAEGRGICTAKAGFRESCNATTGCASTMQCIALTGNTVTTGICLAACERDQDCASCLFGKGTGCCVSISDSVETGVCQDGTDLPD